MKKLYAALLMGVFVFCFSFGQGAVSAETMRNEPRTISVQGNSDFAVAPDQVSVEIGIETTSKTAQEAAQSNAAVMTKVQNALYGIGLTEKNVKTSSYDFYPIYNKDNDQVIDQYRANNTITVTVSDISQVGGIIDTAIKNGANNVNSVTFELKDAQKYKESALKSAILDAKGKAKAIASELGKNIVNVVSVTEGNVYIENYRASSDITMKSMNVEMAAPTPVTAKKLDVSAKLSVVFEID